MQKTAPLVTFECIQFWMNL